MANKVEQNNMKDSGYSWIREVPSDWNIGRIKELFYLSKEKINGNAQDYQIFSLTMKGLKKRDVTTNEGQIAASYDKYARLRKDDIVLNPMDLKSGFVARQSLDGIISPAYSIMRPRRTNINSKFFERYFQYHYFYNIFFPFGKGVSYDYRWTLGDSTLINFPIVVPPKETQEKIVSFLDEKTENIDNLIKKKKKMIELLQEKRSSIITHAVTKGLDPDVEMKDSGIDWIGDTPKSWIFIKPLGVAKVVRGNCTFSKADLKSVGDFVALQYGKTYKVDVINKNYNYYVNNSFYKDNQVVEHGDTILVSTSETIEDLGHSCFYKRRDKGLLGGEQMCLKPNELVTGKFLFYATHYFNLDLNQYATGIKVFRFKVNDLKRVSMVIPSIQEQQNISDYLDMQTQKIDKMIGLTSRQIKLLEEYKSSLIYHTVTGKIKI